MAVGIAERVQAPVLRTLGLAERIERRVLSRSYAPRHPRAAALTIVLVGLVLRLAGLDRKSVWFDEAVSAGFARLSLADVLRATAGDVNPPLYYLLLHVWWPLAQNDFLLRLPSALCSAAAVGLTIGLGRDLFGWRVGLSAGLFTALSPLHIDLGQEARAYGLLSMLAVASVWLLWRAEQRDTWRRWLAFAGVSGLALYAHNFAALLVAAEAFSLILRRERSPKAWAAMALVGVSFVPWLPVLAGQVGIVRDDYWIEPTGMQGVWDTYFDFIAYTPAAHGWGMTLFEKAVRWGIPVVLAIGVIAAIRKPPTLKVVLAFALPVSVALLVSQVVTPIYVVRYAAFVLPFFWLTVARGIDLLPSVLARLGVVAAITIGLAINLPSLYADPFYARSDVRAAAALVASAAQPGELIVHTSPFTDYPFAFYTGDRYHDVLLPDGDPQALRAAVEQQAATRFFYLRDFSVSDPDAAASADAQAREELQDWTVVDRQAVAGVAIYTVSAARH